MCGVERPRILWAPPEERAESDCACPGAGAPPEPELPEPSSGLWERVPDLFWAPLPDGHRAVFNPWGRAGVVVLNRPAVALLDGFRRPRRLDGGPAHQMAALELLRPAGRGDVVPRPAASSPALTAWLHVTNACNLRCTYCYVAKTHESMDETTGLAAVEAIFRAARRHGFRAVKLKYAGGEPTLNFPLVVRLHQHARNLASRHGVALRAVLLSNGVALRPSVLAWLRDQSVRLMISLDGIGPTHDVQRPFAGGQGSFDRVVRGIEAAVAHNIVPHLSITVTAATADHVAAVVDFALDHELPFNLNFYRDHTVRAPAGAWRADEERLIRGVRAAFARIEARLPRRRLIDALVDRSAFDTPHTLACGAGHHYLVVDHRGRVARCHMEIERPIADVWADDPLGAVRAHGEGFVNLPVDEMAECRTCPWRYWCAGGCPLLTFRVTGRSDVKSPYCHVYRALYPHVVRLEGLRLVKWGTPLPT